MTVIRDIQLSIPSDINYFDHTVIVDYDTGETSPFTDYRKSKSAIFHYETRCITSLYTRLLPEIHTDGEKGVIIQCVPDLSRLSEKEMGIEMVPDFITVYVEMDYNQYFSLMDNLEKKKMTLELVQQGVEKLADERGWDKQIFRDIYNKIKELNYKNTFVYKEKSSPNRKYICSIVCEHEVSHVDICLEIKRRNGNKVLRKERLVRVDRPHESFYWRYLGELTWTLNHKVTFTDHLHHFGWIVTFLEKENETQMIWEVNKVSYLSP
ncbi:hypothetical protein HNR43_002222 [Anoxybacillus mongoliensis]|uniref:Uncharacterized protein n=1 Tax=Anoxybacillus mongoliensis TaxID=452565 RepID=A0A7W8JFU1_9BACL|nr:hypothetical protein [Anoxybacillus mongoliensis]MBB5356242.1 hypothetical protein [Anoxybacillus mongoliensis]